MMMKSSELGAELAEAISLLAWPQEQNDDLIFLKALGTIKTAHEAVKLEACTGVFEHSLAWAESNVADQLAWLERTALLLTARSSDPASGAPPDAPATDGAAAGTGSAPAGAPAQSAGDFRTGGAVVGSLLAPWLLLLDGLCTVVVALRPVPGTTPHPLTPRTSGLAKAFAAVVASGTWFDAAMGCLQNCELSPGAPKPAVGLAAGRRAAAAGGSPAGVASGATCHSTAAAAAAAAAGGDDDDDELPLPEAWQSFMQSCRAWVCTMRNRATESLAAAVLLYKHALGDGYGWGGLAAAALQLMQVPALRPAADCDDMQLAANQAARQMLFLAIRLKAVAPCVNKAFARRYRPHLQPSPAASAALAAALSAKGVRRLQLALLERLAVHGGAGAGAAGGGGGGGGSSGGGQPQSWLAGWEAAQGWVTQPDVDADAPKDAAAAQAYWSLPERQRALEATHATWLAASLGLWARAGDSDLPGLAPPPPLALVVLMARRAVEALWRLSGLTAGDSSDDGCGGGGGGRGAEAHRGLGLGGATYGPAPLFTAAYCRDVLRGLCFGSRLLRLDGVGGSDDDSDDGDDAYGGGCRVRSPQCQALLPGAVEVTGGYLRFLVAALKALMRRRRGYQRQQQEQPQAAAAAAAAGAGATQLQAVGEGSAPRRGAPTTAESEQDGLSLCAAAAAAATAAAAASAAAGVAPGSAGTGRPHQAVAAAFEPVAATSAPAGAEPATGPSPGRAQDTGTGSDELDAKVWQELWASLAFVAVDLSKLLGMDPERFLGSIGAGCRAAVAAAARRSWLPQTCEDLLRAITTLQLAPHEGVGGDVSSASGASPPTASPAAGFKKEEPWLQDVGNTEVMAIPVMAVIQQVIALEAPAAAAAAAAEQAAAGVGAVGDAGTLAAGGGSGSGATSGNASGGSAAVAAAGNEPGGGTCTGGSTHRRQLLETGVLISGVKRALALARRLGVSCGRPAASVGADEQQLRQWLSQMHLLIVYAVRLTGPPLQPAAGASGGHAAATSPHERRRATLAMEAHAYTLRTCAAVGLMMLLQPGTGHISDYAVVVSTTLEAWAAAAAGLQGTAAAAAMAEGGTTAAEAFGLSTAQLLACQPHRLLAAACAALRRLRRDEFGSSVLGRRACADLRFRLTGSVLRVLAAAAGSQPRLAPHVLSWLAPDAPAPLQAQAQTRQQQLGPAAQPAAALPDPVPGLRGCLRAALREALPAMVAADDNARPGQENANRAHAAGVAALLELAGYWAVQVDAEAGGGAGGSGGSSGSSGWARRASAAAWRQHFSALAAELQSRATLQTHDVDDVSVEAAGAKAELVLTLRLPVSGASLASSLGGYGSRAGGGGGGGGGGKAAASAARHQRRQQQMQQAGAGAGAGVAQESPVLLPPPLPVDPVGSALWRLRVCGNPGCEEFGGESEAALDLRLCGRCRSVRYCSGACQAAHWGAGHREVCGSVAAVVACRGLGQQVHASKNT